jgi:hypothetical protein
MSLNTVTPEPPFTLPTLTDIQRRRTELLDWQARFAPEQTTDPAPAPAVPPASPVPAMGPPCEAAAWPSLPEAALHGLAGRVVRTMAPHTEADPAAVLLQFLVAFGNLVGPAPHCMVGFTRHSLNLFVVLIGESSKARKGTSWRQIARLFSEVDELWAERRVTTARLTANGLIHALRDQSPSGQQQPTDRRLLLLAEEFASMLQVLGREKGHLSPLLRCAWDTGNLRALDGHHPLQATGTHISLVGHITRHELAQHLHRAESHNGFANRCLWTCVRRSQCLPGGGSLSSQDLAGLTGELRRSLDWVRSQTELAFCRDAAAEELWGDLYSDLSQARPGLYGVATSRAEAQVLRLSAIYAALDCSAAIAPPHLEAALAVWRYCSTSAGLLFSKFTGEPTADRICEALDDFPEGITREQIRDLFHRHVSGDRIDAALERLSSMGIITSHKQSGRGRPTTLWSQVEAANDEAGTP